MKFNITVYELEHYLSKAATGLGSGQASVLSQGFCFSVHEKRLNIWCTDGEDSFAEIETNVFIEEDAEGFILNAPKLTALVANLPTHDDVSFELLKSGKVNILGGRYEGEWSQMKKKHFPLRPDDMPSDTPSLSLNIKDFCRSLEVVKYAAEGLMGAKRRVVFRRGLCWGASGLRFQSVTSGLAEDVDIVIPFASIDVAQFLLKSRQSDEDEFKFVENLEYMYFYVGQDVFVCKQDAGVTKDEEIEFTSALNPANQFWFEIEVEEFHRAVARASLTCEEKSANIRFECSEDVMYVVGVDGSGNQGVDKFFVVSQGESKAMERVRVVGWDWVSAALQTIRAKAVRVTFDKEHMMINDETNRSIFSLVSKNVERLAAGK
jgi:DNA polymerase III sliding clamp (beta) subunit (PCNA family)